MVKLPTQLRVPELRFCLINADTKIPFEKDWSGAKNYAYDSSVLSQHKGNYGIVCGKGNLVVLDFDDSIYHESVKSKLPETFVVTTAGKRLPHYYYFLDGDMFKKIGINQNNVRVCDIQAMGSQVVGPGSSYNRRYYEPNDEEIAHINLQKLKEVFGDVFTKYLHQMKPIRSFEGVTPNFEKKDLALGALKVCKVDIYVEGNMRCPFHGMNGKGNLSILDTGLIYCFHCNFSGWADEFIAKVKNIPLFEAKKIMELIQQLYDEAKIKRKK